eukprot:6338670-Amphidinium_carterae.1
MSGSLLVRLHASSAVHAELKTNQDEMKAAENTSRGHTTVLFLQPRIQRGTDFELILRKMSARCGRHADRSTRSTVKNNQLMSSGNEAQLWLQSPSVVRRQHAVLD